MTDSRSKSTDLAASPAAPAPLELLADGAIAVPAGRRARGRLTPPPSKSLSHRAFNLALLAAGPVVIERPLEAEDTQHFMAALRSLGQGVEEVRGAGGDLSEVRFTAAPLPPAADVHCGAAGTLYRFLVATLAALPGAWTLDGVERLRERPVGPLLDALRPLGARIESLGAGDGYAPLLITGGRLQGGATSLDAGASSQFLSAVLMAALVAEGEVEIAVGALTSAPYVDLTLDMIERFSGEVTRQEGGYRVRPGLAAPPRVRVEADLSAAAYPAAAAALTGGEVVLEGVAEDSRQGDRGLLDLLAEMGAEVRWGDGEVAVRGTGGLTAVEADLSRMPDQVPTLAALAPFAEGTTRIRNVPHLRIKESDRLAAMARELGRVGVEVEELEDGLVIPGVWAEGPPAAPGEVIVTDSHGDHRIAMAMALVGLVRPGVAVGAPGVVGKSYPGFWGDLAGLLGG